MKTIFPDDLSHRDRHQLLLSGVNPRPIAFVSTLSENGDVNLAPYSFFMAFSSKPPIVAIGPAIAARTGKAKDTWLNILATKQATISSVSYSMVDAMNIAAGEYPPDTDEYEKAGFTKAASVKVAPPYVQEAPYAMECVLMDSIELRRDIGGNGNIVLLEVVAFHVSESVLVDGRVDPRRMDLVGRMGYSWYCRAQGDALFTLDQPGPNIGIGIDALPDHIRTSEVLTGSDLAKLAHVTTLPMLDGSFPRFDAAFRADSLEIELAAGDALAALYVMLNSGRSHDRSVRHRIAKAFLAKNQIEEAWQTLLLE